MCIEFSLPGGRVGKNVIIFKADMSSSVHIDNKGKDILILGTGPTKGLNDTTLMPEAQYSLNFTRPNIIFLSLHYNWRSSFLFVNATKIYQLKPKDSEINNYPLCLGNISVDFLANNMKKKTTGLNRCMYEFCLGYRVFDTSNIIGIHNYLMKKHDIK